MASLPLKLLTLVAVFALIAAACGDDADQSSSSSTTIDQAETETSTAGQDLQATYEAFGNPDASTVIVVAQGGPVPGLDIDEAKSIFSTVDLDKTYIAVPHQAQTLDPDRFADTEISFEEAKRFDTDTTAMIADVVQHYVDQDREVFVVGVSFGAFVVQDLLASEGNVADGYLIQVGRLDMPAEVWEPFSEGRFVGFIDGVRVEQFDAEDAGMGGDGDFTDTNMAKLAAGLGHKRYTQLLADTDLGNVVYAYGQTDEQVGRLTPEELAFLDSKGVTVIRSEGGHGEAIDETITTGLSALTGDPVGAAETEANESDAQADGYLPADQVADYVAAFQRGLAQSMVTIGGDELPVQYAGVDGAITIRAEGTELMLELGEDEIEGATIFWQDRQWDVLQEPEVSAVPEALGGDGQRLEMTFQATAADDPTDSLDVGLKLDVNIIGMGDSVVDVVDGYATISGTLGTSTYVQLSEVMAENPDVNTLVMLSVQGSENDEINVHTARLLRSAGWTTWLPANGDISSGGVDMFAAGETRVIESGGFVGVHSWGGGDGERTGRDYPRDDPAHRSQLEYFTEMMGSDAGTEFYFYTLEAAPFDQIHRMSSAEIERYGLVTDAAQQSLPASLVGLPAGYLELAEGAYLKLIASSCEVSGGEVSAELLSEEFGPIDLSASDGSGVLSIPALEGLAPVDYEVRDVTDAEGNVTGVAELELDDLLGGLDTSNAGFDIPCAG